MLIEFTVGNFCSFRDRFTLSMVAAKLAAKDKSLDENNVIVQPNHPPLLTSAAIYGPNASGKSNLIGALMFMRGFALGSLQGTEATGGIGVDPFRLNARTVQQPSHFEVVIIIERQRYRYGFEVTGDIVVNEWLYTVPKKTEVRLFERTPDGITIGASFKEGRKLQEQTRPNALFLSVVAQFNGTIAQHVIGWFRRLGIVSGLNDMSMKVYTEQKLVEADGGKEIVALVTKLDLGIADLKAIKGTVEDLDLPPDMPDELQRAMRTIIQHNKETGFTVEVKTTHRVFDDEGREAGLVEFDLDVDESSGTRKLFAMAAPLMETLARGNTLVVDELDSRLHTALTREIVKLFNSNETNPNGAQLIFTVQDTNLLDNSLFRRDQIWFIEKDSRGASQLYSLAEFNKVRNDLSFERNYIQGRFGAVPYVDDLSTVLKESRESYGA